MIVTQSDRNFYNEHKDEYTHILSIVCPDEKELVTPIHKNHIISKMWDIDKPLENKFRKYTPPNMLDIHNPIMLLRNAWLDSLEKREDFRLLIHCDAGVSRSPAMTLGFLWVISSYVFKTTLNIYEKDFIFKPYIEARKQWCKSLLDWNNSVSLCRYIDGRYNPGVKPNQAILEHFRLNYNYFPW